MNLPAFRRGGLPPSPRPAVPRTAWPALVLLILLPGTVRSADRPAPIMPVRDVVLFSSGVGYFQHAGTIDGATTLPFSFRTEQINDLLKSLVLFDPAGQVKSVTYTASDPLSRELSGLGVDLNRMNSMAGLLRQMQGAQVRAVTPEGEVEGQILSVNVEQQAGKDTTVSVEVLNLLTADGIRSFPLNAVRQVRLLDPALEEKLRQGLALLASGLDRERKSVSIHFGGDRKRDVRLGYLLEAPVWKTSYRLVLSDDKPAYMQGWAIVENMTDENWDSVSLSLVSGQPVSFIQDLFTPLYAPRPVIAPPVVGSPTPQTYGSALIQGEARKLETLAEREMAAPPAAAPMASRGRAAGRPGGDMLELKSDESALADGVLARRQNIRESVEQLARSVSSQAQGEERGELFEYAIRQPISIPSRQAAMVPIVGAEIEAKQVSIYTPRVNATHPMNAVRLKNTTGLHLAGGPITVYGDGIYAGDSQIESLRADEERLLSYAVDLSIEGKVESASAPEQLLSVRADSGLLRITRKMRLDQTYTLRNKEDRARTVILEQPIEADWKLVEPAKADEETAGLYRFTVEVPAKTTGQLKVVTERPVMESMALVDADLNLLATYAGNATLSERLREALKELSRLRRRITDLEQQRGLSEGEIAAITAEQARIRENMKQLDRQDALYQQYVKKLTGQESRIEALRANITRLRQSETEAHETLRKFIDSLNVE